MSYSLIVSVHSKSVRRSARARQVNHLMAQSARKKMNCERAAPVYRLEGEQVQSEAEKICRELLADPVADTFTMNEQPPSPRQVFADVWYRKGVTDAVGESVVRACRSFGAGSLEKASSGTRYLFTLRGADSGTVRDFVRGNLLNPLVQECVIIKQAGKLA